MDKQDNGQDIFYKLEFFPILYKYTKF